ncbi:MAG TPA: hypothetical protein VE570_06215 [Thermoleophilaceae bacterium]|nr:hypothetical protein [Thermoleophilaceae bacterium]
MITLTKPKIVIAAIAVTGAMAVPSLSSAATKTCTTQDSPSNNWSTSNQQINSCNASQSNKSTDTVVTNPGGNTPPSKQP